MWSRPGNLGAFGVLLHLLLSHTVKTLSLGSVTTFTPEHAKAVLEKHNYYRRQESAANMYEMHWNISLQQRADAWIQGCEFKHENCHDAGENLFFSTALHREDIFLRGLKAWHDEISMWSYTSGNCLAACHYTQMIWAWTTTVGCSAKVCPILKTANRVHKDAMLFACYYYPRGNFLGHFPYSRGSSCSECADGDTCSNDLCVSSGPESKSAPDVVKTLKPQTPVRHSMPATVLGGFRSLVKNFILQARPKPQSFTYRREKEHDRIETHRYKYVTSTNDGSYARIQSSSQSNEIEAGEYSHADKVDAMVENNERGHTSFGNKKKLVRKHYRPLESQVADHDQLSLQQRVRESKVRKRKREQEKIKELDAINRQNMDRLQENELERWRQIKDMQAKIKKNLQRKRLELLEKQKDLLLKEIKRVTESQLQKQLEKQKLHNKHEKIHNKTVKNDTKQNQWHENKRTLNKTHNQPTNETLEQRERDNGQHDRENTFSKEEKTFKDSINTQDQNKRTNEAIQISEAGVPEQLKLKQNASALQETIATETLKQNEKLSTEPKGAEIPGNGEVKKDASHRLYYSNKNFSQELEKHGGNGKHKSYSLIESKDKDKNKIETSSFLKEKDKFEENIESTYLDELKTDNVESEKSLSKTVPEPIPPMSNNQPGEGASGHVERSSRHEKLSGVKGKTLKPSEQLLSPHKLSNHKQHKDKPGVNTTHQVRKYHPTIIDDYYSPSSIVTIVRVLSRDQIEQLEEEYEGEEHRPVIIKNPTNKEKSSKDSSESGHRLLNSKSRNTKTSESLTLISERNGKLNDRERERKKSIPSDNSGFLLSASSVPSSLRLESRVKNKSQSSSMMDKEHNHSKEFYLENTERKNTGEISNDRELQQTVGEDEALQNHSSFKAHQDTTTGQQTRDTLTPLQVATTPGGLSEFKIHKEPTRNRLRPMTLISSPHGSTSSRPIVAHEQGYKTVGEEYGATTNVNHTQKGSDGANGEKNGLSKISHRKQKLKRKDNLTKYSWFYKPKSKKKKFKPDKMHSKCRDANPMCAVWKDRCDKNYRVKHTCRATCGKCGHLTNAKRTNSRTPLRLSSYHTSQYLSPESYHGAFRKMESARHNQRRRHRSRHRESQRIPKQTSPLSLETKPNRRPSRLQQRVRSNYLSRVNRREQGREKTTVQGSGDPVAPQEDCEDRSTHMRACQVWSKRGFCRTNSTVRKLYCQKSCGQCDP